MKKCDGRKEVLALAQANLEAIAPSLPEAAAIIAQGAVEARLCCSILRLSCGFDRLLIAYFQRSSAKTALALGLIGKAQFASGRL